MRKSRICECLANFTELCKYYLDPLVRQPLVYRVQSSMGVLRSGVLLYCLHVICAGVFADVWKVHVEPEMKALVSSCVVLPCSFKYPVQEQPSDRIRAIWHMKDNWDDVIFHKDPTKVKDSFKGRTRLIGSLGGSNCSLEIDEVKNHDSGPYCFRVELETSKKDKYSFVENCVLIKMIEQASKPELQAEHSVQEGEPAVFKCSVRHTCPSHQPNITWSHSGKAIMSYKDIGHGNWETESVLTFTPQKEDDHTSITCTVKHQGNVQGEMTATYPLCVKEQATLSHILIPVISGLGSALLVGLLCFFIVRRYKSRPGEFTPQERQNEITRKTLEEGTRSTVLFRCQRTEANTQQLQMHSSATNQDITYPLVLKY